SRSSASLRVGTCGPYTVPFSSCTTKPPSFFAISSLIFVLLRLVVVDALGVGGQGVLEPLVRLALRRMAALEAPLVLLLLADRAALRAGGHLVLEMISSI